MRSKISKWRKFILKSGLMHNADGELAILLMNFPHRNFYNVCHGLEAFFVSILSLKVNSKCQKVNIIFDGSSVGQYYILLLFILPRIGKTKTKKVKNKKIKIYIPLDTCLKPDQNLGLGSKIGLIAFRPFFG